MPQNDNHDIAPNILLVRNQGYLNLAGRKPRPAYLLSAKRDRRQIFKKNTNTVRAPNIRGLPDDGTHLFPML